MPISKKWSSASKKHITTNVPEKSGVYELKAFGELVYIGKASNLRARLLEHFNSRCPNYYRYQTAGFLQSASRLEQKHMDAYGNGTAELPPWNVRDPRR